MRIGIDIDGVLTNIEQYILDNATRFLVQNNIDYKVGQSNYDFYKSLGINKEVELDFWSDNLFNYAKYEKARPYASEIIKKLKEEGNEIYIITARWLTNKNTSDGEKMRNIVRNWLKENDIVYDKLIFSMADNENKMDEILEHNIDLMIEDNPNNINDLSKVIPVICYNTGYNGKCDGNNIYRCYSWYDIYKMIKTMN